MATRQHKVFARAPTDNRKDQQAQGQVVSPPAAAKRWVLDVSPDQAAPAGWAHLSVRPDFNAAQTLMRSQELTGNKQTELTPLIRALREHGERAHANDMRHAETMLVAQATTLDGLFAMLAQRSMRNLQEGSFEVGESYMRLAFRAQAQSRATLETLGQLKNPPVVIARQANVAQQQVNNFRAGEIDSRSNELLGSANEPLDGGATSKTTRSYSALAPVAKLDGTANDRGKVDLVSKRLQGRAKRRASRVAAAAARDGEVTE